jgi:hypothetical protein
MTGFRISFGLALLLSSGEAWATLPHSFPRLSGGGGFVGRSGIAEVTLSPLMAGPHISAGADIGSREGYGYAELGASLLVTFGAGVGYRFMNDASNESATRWHMTLSIPIPLLGWWPILGDRSYRSTGGISLHDDPAVAPRLLYLTPLVRWRRSFDNVESETAFGALLKFSFGPRGLKN